MSTQNSTPKIILVTGGGRGLGRNTAIVLQEAASTLSSHITATEMRRPRS